MATRFSPRQTDGPGAANALRRRLAAFGGSLLEFLKSPLAVGSPIPSLPHTVRKLLEPVDWSSAAVVVEYGPGTGSFTVGALRRMRADATLIAIDCSKGFTDHLRSAIPDQRLHAVTASALDVEAVIRAHGFGGADCIISGIPFSTLPEGNGELLIQASERALRPGGLFLAYQVRDHVRGLLDRHFDRLDAQYEWLNLPPYHLYWYRKPVDTAGPGDVPARTGCRR